MGQKEENGVGRERVSPPLSLSSFFVVTVRDGRKRRGTMSCIHHPF